MKNFFFILGEYLKIIIVHEVVLSIHITLVIFILVIWEFFTPALSDGFPLGSVWQQVFSSLQDSSKYSSRTQQCYSLDGLSLDHLFPNPSVLVTILWWLYRVCQLQSLSPSLHVCAFFTPALAYDVSREFKWQQVFSSLKYFSQYSGQFW